MVLLFVVCGWREEAVARVCLRTYLVHSTYIFFCTRATIYGKIVKPTVNQNKITRVVSHLFTGSLAGIGKLPALAGWYLVWYVRYFLCCKIWRELHFVKFCGNSPQKGGLVHQKGGKSKGKRGSRQMYDTEGPYQVFLWYR